MGNIVIVNLNVDFVDESDVTYEDPGNVKKLFAKCNSAFIDPRPKFMFHYKEKFDRIFKNGGVFVIFAQKRYQYDYVIGEVDSNRLINKEHVNIDNWSFLSLLNDDFLNIFPDEGNELILNNTNQPINDCLTNYLKKSTYNAYFKCLFELRTNSICILKNIYNQCVGMLIKSSLSDPKCGRILILPDMPRSPELILDLLNDVLPSLSPHLFPNVKGKWVESDEYEFKSIKDLKGQIIDIVTTANREIKSLEKEIEHKREEHGFLHGILTGTGDELVDDVEECLNFIGFEKVENIDKKTYRR